MKIRKFNETVSWMNDDEILLGYKYSWSDIFDMVVDFIDLDFKVLKEDRYFINKEGEKIHEELSIYDRKGKEEFFNDIKGTCYIIKMVKTIDLFVFNTPYDYSIDLYEFQRSSSEMLKILEITNQLEKRTKIYHSYKFFDNKISLILKIHSDIVEGFVEQKIKELRESKIRKNIRQILLSPNELFLDNKNYTKKFREEAFDWGIKMDIHIREDNFFEKSEMVIYPINLNFSKQILSSNMSRLENDIKWFINHNKERGISVEWRKITKQEAEKVKDPKIEGMMGIIFKYDIKKLKKYISDKIDKGKEWSI